MKKLNGLLLIALVLTLTSCVGKRPLSKKESSSSEQSGLASWYGEDFNGRKTASGEIYNMNEFTAAHRRLSFGTRVKVTRIDNGKSVVVRINDRGPYKDNRVIDLSAAAARSISLDKDGVTHVKIQKLPFETTTRTSKRKPHASSFYLQVASFPHPKNAKDYAEYVSLVNGHKNVQIAYLNQSHKVWVGPLYSFKDVEITKNRLKSNRIESVILRRS